MLILELQTYTPFSTLTLLIERQIIIRQIIIIIIIIKCTFI